MEYDSWELSGAHFPSEVGFHFETKIMLFGKKKKFEGSICPFNLTSICCQEWAYDMKTWMKSRT